MPSPAVIWTPQDDAKLRAEYPIDGSNVFIRGKVKSAISRRASVLGLRKLKPERYSVGDRSGQRTVVEVLPMGANSHHCVVAECDCGSRAVVKESDLRAGRCRRCVNCQVVKAKKAGGGAVYRNFPRPRAVAP